MKTLFPKQQQQVDNICGALGRHSGVLDSSMTGVGKTVVACAVAQRLGVPVAVICPKIVIPHWQRELAEFGVTPVFVTNYEKIKRGNEFLVKVGKKMFRWNLPKDTLLIFDEAHNCKSPWTQNSQMLIAAKQAGFKCLMLSATACQDPTEMRSIGYALDLHSLNRPDSAAGLTSWFGWMKQLGCKQDPWNNWKAGPVAKLKGLNSMLYGRNAFKLTHADLPDAFAANHVITEPLAFGSLKDIAAFYEEHGVTPEIIENAIEGISPEPHILVEILRARQLAEAAKVPDIVTMVQDACAEGYSVVVFVNFTDTVRAMHEHFPEASIIIGGQSGDNREENVQRFQRNETNVIICNSAAGGVGVSLHDTTGDHPRMSLISPTYDVKVYVQMLGRIHRNGAKSPATQRVLVAAGTIEEKIVTALERKRLSMDTLHAQPTSANS